MLLARNVILYEFSADQSGVSLARGSPDYAQRAGHRAEQHFFHLAHVLAIQLEGDRPARAQLDGWEVVAGDDAPTARRLGPFRKHLAQNPQRAYRPQPAEAEQVQTRIGARVRVGVDRPAA